MYSLVRVLTYLIFPAVSAMLESMPMCLPNILLSPQKGK